MYNEYWSDICTAIFILINFLILKKMKRISYFFLSLSLILFSCQKNPVASFSVDTTTPEVGQSVFFTNESDNADSYDWDFGDGFGSNERNPVHYYTATGPYDVSLIVAGKGSRTDESGIKINVQVPTLLAVEVREYYSDNVVPNTSVLLYPTLADWDNQTNSVMEAITDQDGVAVFSGLDPFIYYVDVFDNTHDNYQLRQEDIGFIRTPQVITHRITSFVAYVDVVSNAGTRKGTRDNLIMKGTGRKAADKNLIPGFQGSWQELLKRKVVK